MPYTGSRSSWDVALEVDFTLEPFFDFYNGGVPGATTPIAGATWSASNLNTIQVAEVDAGGLGLHLRVDNTVASLVPANLGSIGFALSDFPAITQAHEVAMQMIITPIVNVITGGQNISGLMIRDTAVGSLVTQEFTFGSLRGVRTWRYQGSLAFGATPANADMAFLEGVVAPGGCSFTAGSSESLLTQFPEPGAIGYSGTETQRHHGYAKVPQSVSIFTPGSTRAEVTQVATTATAIQDFYVERLRVLYRKGN